MEQWRAVVGFPDYEVSDLGNVRSWKVWGRKATDPARILSPGEQVGGYLKVYLSVDKRVKPRLVHRLVLESFVGPCPEGWEARHLNGNGKDNRLENLEWSTHMANMQDKVAHGTLNRNRPSGDTHQWARLTACQVREIRVAYDSGRFTQQQLADQYNTSRANIGLIVTRKNWKGVEQ